jgi:hypothetical protein
MFIPRIMPSSGMLRRDSCKNRSYGGM